VAVEWIKSENCCCVVEECGMEKGEVKDVEGGRVWVVRSLL
jgi:hypothetical protein